MQRFRLVLEYDGRPFCGWQHQPGRLSVQRAMEEAVMAFCGEQQTVFASGRTDAGVHALGQCAHVDIARPTPPAELLRALNHHLRMAGHPVAVHLAEAVPDSFHARFSSRYRQYQYRIINRFTPLVLDAGRAWHRHRPLDAAAMQQAASLLIGKHDFSTFRDADCQAPSAVKTLTSFTIHREGECLYFRVQAPSFLHHQVRNMVGSLVRVGEGKWRLDDFRQAFAACNRQAGGMTAPAEGLYFTGVGY